MKLGGEVAMENITLEGVRALRAMITATVHDVLYYMSPVYCQDIIDSVIFYILHEFFSEICIEEFAPFPLFWCERIR